MYYLSTPVQCCFANVTQWDYHIYLAVHKNVFMCFVIIQPYGNVAMRVKANKKTLGRRMFSHNKYMQKSQVGKKRLPAVPRLQTEMAAVQAGIWVSQPNSAEATASFPNICIAVHSCFMVSRWGHDRLIRYSLETREIGVFPFTVNGSFLYLDLVF